MLKRKDLIHPQLSYAIIGVLFDVYNNLGPGHREKYYQKAIATALKTAGISFKEQVAVPYIAQTYGYLTAKKLQLGILANFTKSGLQSNIRNYS